MERKGRNQMIDGWRGASVLLVIASHLIGYHFADYFRATTFKDLFAAGVIDWPQLGWNIVLRLFAPLGEDILRHQRLSNHKDHAGRCSEDGKNKHRCLLCP
jgi:hypothetical protein